MLWNDDYYSQLESEFGQDIASRVAQSHRAAIDYVEDVSISAI